MRGPRGPQHRGARARPRAAKPRDRRPYPLVARATAARWRQDTFYHRGRTPFIGQPDRGRARLPDRGLRRRIGRRSRRLGLASRRSRHRPAHHGPPGRRRTRTPYCRRRHRHARAGAYDAPAPIRHPCSPPRRTGWRAEGRRAGRPRPAWQPARPGRRATPRGHLRWGRGPARERSSGTAATCGRGRAGLPRRRADPGLSAQRVRHRAARHARDRGRRRDARARVGSGAG